MTTHNLRPQITPFVGRINEVAEIMRLLADPTCRLVTLVGPGGIGKTRLALEAARHVVPILTNGVFFIPLQPLTSPDFIVSAIADAIGFQFYAGTDPKQQLLDYFRDKSSLLILDNLEHLLDGIDLLSEILAHAPDVSILATSRERLNLREEWVLDVEGLPVPVSDNDNEIAGYGAVQLFLQNAQRAQGGFALTDKQKPAVTRICRLVAGMPLGIELAAAWVRALSCEQIASELERSLDILETHTRNVEPRHRTMRAAFEPTWERLTDDERGVFMKLSVFRGGFTREAAEYVAGATLRTLTALLDKSLLRVDANGRYDLHELLRQYGEEKLNVVSDEATRTYDSHCTFYSAFMQRQWSRVTGSEVKESLNEIEQEVDNVRAAWQWAVERQKLEAIDQSMDSLWFFYDRQCWLEESHRTFSRVTAVLRGVHDEQGALLARALIWQGWTSSGGETEKALFEESLAIARRISARREIALALLNLGVNSILAGAGISEESRQCLELFRQIGDDWGIGTALQVFCYAAANRGDYDEARRYGQESIAFCSKTGNLGGIAAARVALSNAALYAGHYEEAHHLALASFQLAEEMGHRNTLTDAFILLAFASLELGNQQQAYQYAAQAIKYACEGRVTYHILRALAVFERIFASLCQFEKALEIASLIDCVGKQSGLTRWTLTPYDYPGLNGELSLEVYVVAVERGKTLDLEVVVNELLADWSQQESNGTVFTDTPLEPNSLTERELEILRLIADGYSNSEIADQLFLAVSTVKWYNSEIFSKLHVANRTQAVARARALGLLS